MSKIKEICICQYEIENKLPRTRFCFMACDTQRNNKFKKENIKTNNNNPK